MDIPQSRMSDCSSSECNSSCCSDCSSTSSSSIAVNDKDDISKSDSDRRQLLDGEGDTSSESDSTWSLTASFTTTASGLTLSSSDTSYASEDTELTDTGDESSCSGNCNTSYCQHKKVDHSVEGSSYGTRSSVEDSLISESNPLNSIRNDIEERQIIGVAAQDYYVTCSALEYEFDCLSCSSNEYEQLRQDGEVSYSMEWIHQVDSSESYSEDSFSENRILEIPLSPVPWFDSPLIIPETDLETPEAEYQEFHNETVNIPKTNVEDFVLISNDMSQPSGESIVTLNEPVYKTSIMIIKSMLIILVDEGVGDTGSISENTKDVKLGNISVHNMNQLLITELSFTPQTDSFIEIGPEISEIRNPND